jgi:formate hydrogenlyase subunit 4
LLAAIMAAQAFCALGSSRAASSTYGYIVLLAIVFTPVVFIWCNARPYLINRILEGTGWALLIFLWVIAVGSI